MILSIETSTIACSVALSDGDKLLSIKESMIKNSHSSIITVFIKKVLDSAKKDFSDLKAVAVSKGPGSYTGLRIGVSAAKGIAYALNIPLIGISTLQAMAKTVSGKLLSETGNGKLLTGNELFCPMIDARRMEVYYALYDSDNKEFKSPVAEIITESTFTELLYTYSIIFFGDGADKCKSVVNNLNASFIDDVYPSAKDMLEIAYEKYNNKEFENVAYFEPFYLKDFIANIPKVKGLR